jgi:hypothetical protein
MRNNNARTHTKHAMVVHKQPYAYQHAQMMKQFPTANSLVSPTSTVCLVTGLSSIPIGTTDNTRLGEKVILRTLDIEGTVWQTSNAAATAPRPNICSRMLIVADSSNTGGSAAAINPLTSYDPRATIDNTKVPSQVEIFYDSGPIITTPPTSSAIVTSIQDINRLTHRIHVKVDLSRPIHVSRMSKQYNGILASYADSSTSYPESGGLYALFFSDDASGQDRVDWNVGFSLGFTDYIKGIQSQVSLTTKMAALEAKLLTLSDEKQPVRPAGFPSCS